MVESNSFMFDPFNFFFDTFDRKLQQYIEGDFVNYSRRKLLERNNPEKYEKYKEPFAVLTLGELEAAFVVSLLPLVLSVLVFALELMITLKDFIVFCLIFKTYFAVKDSEQQEYRQLIKDRSRKIATKSEARSKDGRQPADNCVQEYY